MAETASVSDPTDIYMWRRLEAHLTTSGQPKEDQITALKELGVTHVVNLGLHTHEKALADEAGTVRAQGMTYIHIPVDFDNPTDHDFEQFRSTMRALEGNTIHIHCIANLRVSSFLYRYRRDDLMMPEADARAEMERVWRPGNIWARFIGDQQAEKLPHRYAKRDYET